jgi:hypothetical protein
MTLMEIKTTLSRGYENGVNTGRLDGFGKSKTGMAWLDTLLLFEDHVDPVCRLECPPQHLKAVYPTFKHAQFSFYHPLPTFCRD